MRLILCLTAIFWLYNPAISLADYNAGTAGYRGGKFTRTLNCGDLVPVGLGVKGATYVHGITLLCAERLSGNRTGKIKKQLNSNTGSSVGDTLFGVKHANQTRYCPKNYEITGLKVKAGRYVDRIMTIRCQRVGGTALKYIGVGVGGDGGEVLRMYCRRGDQLKHFTVKLGSWVDSISTQCN